MKRTILFLSLFLSLSASAQIKDCDVWEEIEQAMVEVHYDYTYSKDTLENKLETKRMMLRAGRTVSMFVSPIQFARHGYNLTGASP